MAEFLEGWVNERGYDVCVGSAGLGMDGKEVPNDRQASSGQQKPEVKFHCLTHADICNDNTFRLDSLRSMALGGTLVDR
jgi:hypothetical protein